MNETKSRPSFLAFVAVGTLALGALIFLYSANTRKDAELASLRAEVQNQLAQAEQARAEEAAAHKAELDRLRAENSALSRLREDVRQLREDAQQKQAAAQAVQTYAAAAQAQQSEQNQQLLAAAQRARNEAIQRNTCINNLRAIDRAKQDWASRRFGAKFTGLGLSPAQLIDEHNKIADSIPAVYEIQSYFNGSVFPTCPAGGTYTINAVKVVPACSIPGHVLPE
jgi:hypothetical protein